MIDFCRQRGFILRLIENMPMGTARITSYNVCYTKLLRRRRGKQRTERQQAGTAGCGGDPVEEFPARPGGKRAGFLSLLAGGFGFHGGLPAVGLLRRGRS